MEDFSKKYACLVCPDIPKRRLLSYPPSVTSIPEKYRKKFIHPEDGFVKLYCEEYDEATNKEPERREKQEEV